MPDSLVERLREEVGRWYETCSRLRRERVNVTADRDEWHMQHENLLAMYHTTSAELAALREQVARLEKDAGRYRWLRSCDTTGADWTAFGHYAESELDARLDAAIDAAIAQQQGTPEG